MTEPVERGVSGVPGGHRPRGRVGGAPQSRACWRRRPFTSWRGRTVSAAVLSVPRALLAALLALVLLATACASVNVPDSLPGSTTTTAPAPAPAEEPPDCGDPLASLRPTGPAGQDVAPRSYMDDIQERGRLRVGVDVATLQLSSVDPLTGEFQGFDADIAREVALALFGGNRDRIDERIQFVGIPSSARIAVLTPGEKEDEVDLEEPVDLVASAFTINCERREEIEFSTEYFRAGQRVLVRSDDEARSIEELVAQGGTICVSAGSTAIDNIDGLGLDPPADVVPAPERADCLVRLQQGEADAMVTDDAILAGMAAQDPSLEVVGKRLSEEPYGLGLPPGEDEWVRYVNAVLEEVRDSGRWSDLYDRWLADLLRDAEPPPPVYQD